jgi:hypothetical protein
MKVVNSIKSMLIATVAVSCLSFGTLAFAENSVNNAKDIPKEQEVAEIKLTKGLSIQNYEEGSLSIQFRYVDGYLKYIRFLNKNDRPMELRIYDETYVLGAEDILVVNPPSTKYLIFTYSPHEPLTIPGILNQVRAYFGNAFIYTLPKNIDKDTNA